MEIYINNFTKLKINMINENISSKMFDIEIENKFFKYKDDVEIEDVRLNNLILQIGRLLKEKILTNDIIRANDEKLEFIITPEDVQIILFLTNNEEKEISNYILTLEREDIISLYMYLCEVMKKENIFNLPNEYKYMYLYVRYIDIDTTKQFCYISDDKNIRIGDYVLVNRKDEYAIAIVEKIEFYTKEDVPYPIENTKEIIRRVERSELKYLENTNGDETDESDSYVTKEEFKETKLDLDTIKLIVKNQNNAISLKELMKQIIRDNIYLDVYYYPKMNIFIGKAVDIYFLADYKRTIFSKAEYKEMIKNSISIPVIADGDIKEIYDSAIKICRDNNLDYQLDVKIEQNIINEDMCNIKEIFDKKQDKSDDLLYKHICEQVYSNLKMYVRDTDLNINQFDLYKENIGKIIEEKEYIECTSKIGGQAKNTRFFIISNEIRDYSIFEEDTNWGICITSKEVNFKIIDAKKINNKNYIILLQIPNKIAVFMKKINTNVDENLKDFCNKEFNKRINEQLREELDEIWYDRVKKMIGINKEGKINLI